jgi:uncharacterized membrane protein
MSDREKINEQVKHGQRRMRLTAHAWMGVVSLIPTVTVGYESACLGYPACWWISAGWLCWHVQASFYKRRHPHEHLTLRLLGGKEADDA